jgi:hypothetical protein
MNNENNGIEVTDVSFNQANEDRQPQSNVDQSMHTSETESPSKLAAYSKHLLSQKNERL